MVFTVPMFKMTNISKTSVFVIYIISSAGQITCSIHIKVAQSHHLLFLLNYIVRTHSTLLAETKIIKPKHKKNPREYGRKDLIYTYKCLTYLYITYII